MKQPWPLTGPPGLQTPRTSAAPTTSPRSSSPGDAHSGTPCRRAQSRWVHTHSLLLLVSFFLAVGCHLLFFYTFTLFVKLSELMYKEWRGSRVVSHCLPQSVFSLSKLQLLNPCICATSPPPTHTPFPPPCSMSPLPPFQSSTLFSLSLLHLGGGGGIWWTGCPVPDQADYQGLALPYCTLCTVQMRVGVSCSFSLG